MGERDGPVLMQGVPARDESNVYCSEAIGRYAKAVLLRLVACWKPAISQRSIVERLMKRMYGSVAGKVFVFVAGVLMALTMSGCNDPTVVDFKVRQRQMGDICQQELRQGLAGFPPTTQAPTFYPAP